MRTKHGKSKGKGEIFRKQLCALNSGYESEESSESVEKEASLPRREKDRNKSKTKVDNRSRHSKESHLDENEERQKKSTEKEKSRRKLSRSQIDRRKQDEKHAMLENKDNKMHQKIAEQSAAAVITKNRLTMHIGIYNKSKRSKTILRENLREKLCSKVVQAETEKDISRVLDCSSFGINSSGGGSVSLAAMQGTPENQNCSSIYHSSGSTGKQSSCNTSGKEGTIPKNENLEFKTPLQEISENLVQSLNPLVTFRGRNYLTEVQEQLRKMFKQSSAGLQQDRSQERQTPEPSSAVYRRCLKRKLEGSVKDSSVQHLTSTESKLEERPCPGQQQHHKHGIHEMCKSHGETREIPLNTADPASHPAPGINFYVAYSSSRIPQGKPTRPTRGEKENANLYQADSRRVETNPNNHDCLPSTSHGPVSAGKADTVTSSSYDILDFLDCMGQHRIVSRNLSEQNEFGTPDLLEVSPPKKPTLEPSPERKFYPRKLY